MIHTINIKSQNITLAFPVMTIILTLFITAITVLIALLLHKQVNLKNIAYSFIATLLSFVPAYGYYLFFKKYTDMGYLQFESFALVIFIFQTILLSVIFRKKERGFILSLIAASGLALLLTVQSLYQLPDYLKNRLVPYRKKVNTVKETKQKNNELYFQSLKTKLKDQN